MLGKKVWQIYSKFSLGHSRFEVTAALPHDITSKVFLSPTKVYIFAIRGYAFSPLFLLSGM